MRNARSIEAILARCCCRQFDAIACFADRYGDWHDPDADGHIEECQCGCHGQIAELFIGWHDGDGERDITPENAGGNLPPSSAPGDPEAGKD